MLRFLFVPYCEEWGRTVSAAGGHPIARFVGVDLSNKRTLSGMLISSTHSEDNSFIKVIVLSATTGTQRPSDEEFRMAAKSCLSQNHLLLDEMRVPFEGLSNARAFLFEDDDTRFLNENRQQLDDSALKIEH